jgi:hypothetical protein
MGRVILTALLFFSAILSTLADDLVARIDRQILSTGETLELTLTLDRQVLFGEPDISALKKDFQVLSQNRQSRISIVNGKNVSLTQWQFTLSPRREGSLLIPSFSYEGMVSDALEVEVRTPDALVSPGTPVFTEAIVEKSSVYVQEQALVTFKLYTTLSLSNFEMSEISIPDAQVIKVAESQYQKKIDENDYTVVETQLAIFADKSGVLTIPAMRYSGIIRDSRNPYDSFWLNRSGQRRTFATQEKLLTIKPRPFAATTSASSTPSHWLPAREITLQERWSKDEKTLTVGEPVTRTITLIARGLTAAQLPPFSQHADNHQEFKSYNDQPQLEDSTGNEGVTGNRIESMAIVPIQAGVLTLPEIRVPWWDTGTDQMREAILEEVTFEILPAAKTGIAITDTPAVVEVPQSDTTTGYATSPSNWTITRLIVSNTISLALALIFFLMWWRRRPTNSGSFERDADEFQQRNKSFKSIRLAAFDNDYTKLRDAIIIWARGHWQDQHIHTLEQVAVKIDKPEIKHYFSQLDNRLYARQANDVELPDLQRLVEELEKINKHPIDHHSTKTRQLLPLYPQ